LESIYYNKHSTLDGEKMAKFEILGKISQKVCTFWQTKRNVEAKSFETVLAKLHKVS